MPMYEYRCEECGKEFEKLVRFSEADLSQACPNCGAKRTYKKISASASFGYSSSVGGGGGSLSYGGNCGSGGGFS